MTNRRIGWATRRLTLLAAIATAACGARPPAQPAATQTSVSDPALENLRAFTRLYGYVRYFHPSDEASAIDWAGFAVYGAARVKSAATPAELTNTLEELFAPIAPTLRLTVDGQPPAPIPELTPADPAGLAVVAWQHKGYGSAGNSYGTYVSKRRYRAPVTSLKFGTYARSLDVTPYHGKKLRLRSAIRAAVVGRGNQAQMWLRVDRSDGKMGFFDNMDDRPITSPDWAVYELVGPIADDAEKVVFGVLLSGVGQAWSDSFELAVEDQPGVWTPIALTDLDFEADDSPAAWALSSNGYRSVVDDHRPHAGKRALRIESVIGEGATEGPGDLFDAYPRIGERIERDLGRGIHCFLPLALYSKDGHTLPPGDVSELVTALPAEIDDPADENVRLAAVVIAWNVFQHFYPYFDVVDVAWDQVLDDSLRRALAGDDLETTLAWLVAQLDDGHGRVMARGAKPPARLPAQLEWVEDQAIVTRTGDPLLQPGDAILSIDGRDVTTLVRDAEALASGSAQWKKYRAVTGLGTGAPASTVALVVDRAGQRLELEVTRTSTPPAPTDESIRLLERDIYYVDLSRASMAEIDQQMAAIAAAPGVVFDLRGYPNSNHQVLSHLLTQPDTSTAWMLVPRIIYPDHDRGAGWEEHGWGLPVAQPHISGKVVFLTNAHAISYAESFMSFVEHYRLGEIVGSPTAGANGNVNPFSVPGGFTISWTGMRVRKHDGSQHHTIGIVPTVPLEPTRAGIAAGRDELLERALSLIPR